MTKTGRGNDARTPDVAALQQSGTTVAADQIVGLPIQCQGKEEIVIGIVGLDTLGQSRQVGKNDGPLQVVDHGSDPVCWQDGFELGVTADTT